MNNTTIKQKSIKDFFDENKTNSFIKEMESALANLSLDKLKNIFEDYNILHLEASQDLIGQLRFQLFPPQKENRELIPLPDVEPRLSRCIGCSFGCEIKVFKYQYKERVFINNSIRNYYDIVYEHEFGIQLIVDNNILTDIGVCNAFLNKEECDQLK